jgi:N-acetylglutamate synthase-like GNAT family acetyltransferase
MAAIIDYDDKYHEDFKRLNLEWLERFNLVEPHDLEVLDHPQEFVIDKGGILFLLKDDDGSIIGSAGLYRMDDEEYELIKMSVAPEQRGKKYGDLLLQTCIDKAREIGLCKLILYSNSNLQTAIKLYEKSGFNHVAVVDAPFETADIKMELVL